MMAQDRITSYNVCYTKLLREQNPEKFAETEYLEALNDELLDSYSFLVVKKNDVIVFAGNSAMTERMSEFLPDYGGYQTDVDGGIYVSGKNPVLIKQKDFLYDDGSTGSVFIVTDVTNFVITSYSIHYTKLYDIA